MPDWLTNLSKWLKTGKNLQGLGTVVGGLGGLYGNIQQGKYAKSLIDLQKQDYLRGVKKQDKADKTLADAYASSSYVKPLVKL